MPSGMPMLAYSESLASLKSVRGFSLVPSLSLIQVKVEASLNVIILVSVICVAFSVFAAGVALSICAALSALFSVFELQAASSPASALTAIKVIFIGKLRSFILIY